MRWWPWARQEPGWQAALRAAWAEANLQAEARAAEQTALDDAEYQVHLAEMAGARAWLAEHHEPELEYTGEVADYSQNYLTGGEPRSRAEERWFHRFDADVSRDTDPGPAPGQPGPAAAQIEEGPRLEAWEYGPDAARYEPALVQADEEADRHVSPAGGAAVAELAEMDAADIDTAIAEEEERAERSWERWMDEMGEEDPEGRYVAGRDPRSEAEAQQFAEWDAASQAEAAAHAAQAAWDFTGTGPESAAETETSWAGAGFTQPGPEEPEQGAIRPFGDADPGSAEEARNIMAVAGKYFHQAPGLEEPEDAMTPEQEADELVGPAGGPDMNDEQRARAAEYSGQYVRGQADAQNGTAAAPERGTEQETAGYSAGQRWGQSHPAAYQQARGDQREPDRQMEA